MLGTGNSDYPDTVPHEFLMPSSWAFGNLGRGDVGFNKLWEGRIVKRVVPSKGLALYGMLGENGPAEVLIR